MSGTAEISSADPIRVMVVDDSAVIRGLTTRILEEDTSLQVVASVGNGQLAVSNLARYDVDVIVLDIEMPVMDGLQVLKLLQPKYPDIKFIMVTANDSVSKMMDSMMNDAFDYVPKPINFDVLEEKILSALGQ